MLEDANVPLRIFLLELFDVTATWGAQDVEDHVQLVSIASGVESEITSMKRSASYRSLLVVGRMFLIW